MSRTEQSIDRRELIQLQKKRAKRRKQAKRRLLFLIFIIFALGFLAGFLVGSRKEHTLNFTMSSETPEAAYTKPTNLPWNLELVNFQYPLDKDFAPSSLADINNGYEADSRIARAAKYMIEDAASENVRILTVSAYRDYDYQQELFNNKVHSLQKENGYSVSKAQQEAATVVAAPGTSEHQLGLALDLVDANHVVLDESQEETVAYQWLKAHCHEYGFIVRYPNGKTEITGIIYEPWHFRYVGEEAAKIIMENEITLEEYLRDYL